MRELAVDHSPRHHENSLNVKKDKQHCHHVKAHAETGSGVANRLDATFVGSQLYGEVAMPPDEPGCQHHHRSKSNSKKHLHQKWKILPVVGNHLHPVLEDPQNVTAFSPGQTAPTATGRWFELRFQTSSRQGDQTHPDLAHRFHSVTKEWFNSVPRNRTSAQRREP